MRHDTSLPELTAFDGQLKTAFTWNLFPSPRIYVSPDRPTDMITIDRLAVDHFESGLGIDTPRPRLSWRFKCTASELPRGQDWIQTAYELEVDDPAGKALDDRSHSTHLVQDSRSVLVPWPAELPSLTSRARRNVRVRARGQDGRWTAWSASLQLELGLLHQSDWQVDFVTGHRQPRDRPKRPFYLRAQFRTPPVADRATDADSTPSPQLVRLYVTARGLYEPHLNGRPVSSHVLAPGWQSYQHRLTYQTFDVSDHLNSTPGSLNTLGIILGEGWYSGRLG